MRSGRAGVEATRKFYKALTEALLKWEESEHILNEALEDGCTLRDHLSALERKTGITHELLSGREPLRQDARYIWSCWCQMRNDQGYAGSVNARAMQDWQWLTGNRLNMAERKIIQSLENQWRRKK